AKSLGSVPRPRSVSTRFTSAFMLAIVRLDLAMARRMAGRRGYARGQRTSSIPQDYPGEIAQAFYLPDELAFLNRNRRTRAESTPPIIPSDVMDGSGIGAIQPLPPLPGPVVFWMCAAVKNGP